MAQKGTQKDFFTHLKYKLEAGEALSLAFSNSNYFFTSFYIGMIKAGEQSGKLSEIFELLHSYMKKRAALRRDLIQALIYPITILVVAFFVLIFTMNYFVPGFVELFADQ